MIIGLIVVGFLCIIPMACIIGMISGTVQGFREVRSRKAAEIIIKAENNNIIQPEPLYEPLTAPETVLDEIQALEHSADVYRRKMGYYEQQAAVIYDPLEKIKMEEKAAAAHKKMIAELKKVDKLKNKYGVL